MTNRTINTQSASSNSRSVRARAQEGKKTRLWLYGRHAAAAAIANPTREICRIIATKNAIDWLSEALGHAPPPLEAVKPDAIDRLLPKGAVHQGLAVEAFDLPRVRLKDVCASPTQGQPVLVLDQITDPQNIGAIFRSAAAFNARAIITQDRRTPPFAGALAKAAAGAVEHVPCVRVVNIARSLEALNAMGYESVALASSTTDESIRDLDLQAPLALVLGAEGAGLRPLVAQTCTRHASIPVSSTVESLNVSVAAAIALYALTVQS